MINRALDLQSKNRKKSYPLSRRWEVVLRAYTLFERTQVKLIHAVACFMTCSQMARFAAVAAPLYDRKPVVKREIYY